MRLMTARWILPGVLFAAVVLYFVGLGDSTIWDANETFYVNTPLQMLARGDYVVPMFNDEPRLNKPVLSYWMVAGLYHLFGVSVAVQRVGIAIGALLIIACAYVLGHLLTVGLLEERRRTLAASPAVLAAAGLAVDPRIVMFGRRIFIDIWIAAFMALTLTFFAMSERFPERRRIYLLLMYVSVGLGILTKGPVAALLPGLVFAVYLIVHRELRRTTSMMILPGILIVAAIVVPWYYQLYQRDGWTYIQSFFIGENLGRFTSGIGQETRRPWYFYMPSLLGDFFPLSLFLVSAAMVWWKRRDRFQTLLWLWVAVIVLFFSLSHDKQDLYILPIAPALAALAAFAIGRQDETPRVTRAVALTVGVLLAVLGAGILTLFGMSARIYAIDGASVLGILALAGGLAAAALAARRRTILAVVAVLLSLLVIDWVLVLRVLPDFERYKPVAPLSEYLAPRLRPGDRVVHFEVGFPSMVHYLQRRVDPYYSAEALVEAMRSPSRVYAVLPEGRYERLQPELGATTCVLQRAQTFDVKLRDIVRRAPLPHVVLITNDCEGAR